MVFCNGIKPAFDLAAFSVLDCGCDLRVGQARQRGAYLRVTYPPAFAAASNLVMNAFERVESSSFSFFTASLSASLRFAPEWTNFL